MKECLKAEATFAQNTNGTAGSQFDLSAAPDLNPIEHVWRMLKHKLHKLFPGIFDLLKISALINRIDRQRRQCCRKGVVDQALKTRQ